jgi:hypothetical protein
VRDREDIQKPRILALDGGGVRGLSSLLILRELMGRVALSRSEKTILPCDYFDLIIGTGTGGISALLLGRMRMSVDEAIVEYIHIAKAAFKPKPPTICQTIDLRRALLDGAVLEKVVREVVEKVLGDHDARLASDLPHALSQCQTAVLAITPDSADSPAYVFRSYTAGTRPACTFTIPEVACATASTAGLFPPVRLGNPPMRFIDAGTAGYSNPAEVGLREAEDLWPGQEIDCLVSLGTGQQKIVSVGRNGAKIAEASKAIVGDCEKVHNQVQGDLHESQYFRFNVARGLDAVDIMEWSEAWIGFLTGVTESYMRWRDVDNKLNTCVSALNGENRSEVCYYCGILTD